MKIPLESTFESVDIQDYDSFYPRKGFANLKGSPHHKFYVVTVGCVPGIYTHWEDVSPLVFGFPYAAYKKHTGWCAAVSAWDASRRPPMPAPSAPLKLAPPLSASTQRADLPPPLTPRMKIEPHVKIKAEASATPTSSTRSSMASRSVPSTPTRGNKLLYVCSNGNNTTIFANKQYASSSFRRALADGSFLKLEVTPSVSDALEHAEESALEVYNISSDEE
ncbi:hypothetical protein MSAN_00829900 [Mycena sanguinolenta]|uniref:Ribonuclease H1 N-terminal domain-containing protein n=1 Tax=Mycena sanguinolenta TaxID=230812 RepID=A0A8H7DCC0_9AGAR|nr:hypothetical protein MSAN_00829900 [Mycena sanguinolenta]